MLVSSSLLLPGCGGGSGGSGLHQVATIIDGDTFDLADGTRVRMLGIDTPERSAPAECWANEAYNALSQRLAGRRVRLEYDVERTDVYGRTLAWVYDGDVFVNGTMLADGHACVLVIPPNGQDRESYLQALQSEAQAANRGLWAACGSCDEPGGT